VATAAKSSMTASELAGKYGGGIANKGTKGIV
jgi:hypothetical protein